MKGRPLLGFTVCWITGSAAACLFSGYKLLILWAGCLLLLAIYAACGRLGWKQLAVFAISLAVAALYWEWNEGRNVSQLPKALASQPAELQESNVEAGG